MSTETNLFSVCPHDTARGLERWGFLNTYVNKNLELGSRYRPHLNFAEFNAELEAERFLWAYLNPADFLKVRGRFGYVGLARPAQRPDIAYVVQRAGDPAAAGLSDLGGRRLAAVNGYMYRLVADRLRSDGVAWDHVLAKSYSEVMSLVGRGEAAFGVTYNEHFDLLTQGSKEQFRVVATLDAGLSHVVAAHPSLPEEKQEGLRSLLIAAQENSQGRKVLSEVEILAFEPVLLEPFATLQAVLERSAG